MSFSSLVTSGPRMKCWLAQTLSMAARASDFKLAYCGFRSSRGTCMVDIVVAVANRGAKSNRLAPGSHCRRRVRGLELPPQAASLAGLADEFQEGLVGELLLRRRAHHTQGGVRANQRPRHRTGLMSLRRTALTQTQCNLAACHGQID